MRRTILAAALVVGCGSGTPDTPPASSGGCKSSLCSSGSGAAGVKWQVLSVDGNVKGGAAPRLPSDSPIPGLRANSIRQSLALGLRHSCALPSAGGAICWGDNRQGQIGNGGIAAGLFPAPAKVSGLEGDAPIQIAAGDAHTCALTASGSIYCWGSNSNGQLGLDPAKFPNATSPVKVPAPDIVFSQVAAGGNTTCGLNRRSVAYCWGSNLSGQLGDGTTTDSFVPKPVLLDGVPILVGHIAISAHHTCITNGPDTGLSWGAVHCFGDDAQGQLANTHDATPLAGTRIFPAPVLSLPGPDRTSNNGLNGLELIERLAGGAGYTCGITIYGNYYCWGDDALHQLGDIPGNSAGPFSGDLDVYPSTAFGDPPGGTGQVAYRDGPVKYTAGSFTGMAQLVSGSNHVCTLPGFSGCRIGDGYSACCWGSNSAGQSGPNALAGASGTAAGVRAPGGFFNELAAGGDHTCAISSSGDIDCWGDNAFGELGTGSDVATSSIPVAVAGGPWFHDVTTAPAPPPPPGGQPLVDCQLDPNVGIAPNQGNLSSYLFYMHDVFSAAKTVTEVDFQMYSDNTTSANEFALTLYSYDGASYSPLGRATAANLFAAGESSRFVFSPGVRVPAGGLVLQVTQLSGITLTVWSHAIQNPATAACPIKASEAFSSIPLQIYAE